MMKLKTNKVLIKWPREKNQKSKRIRIELKKKNMTNYNLISK